MKIFEYSGTQPVKVYDENTKIVLDIIQTQLKILEKLLEEKWLVQNGTKINSTDLK